jgi:hypothetical protein
MRELNALNMHVLSWWWWWEAPSAFVMEIDFDSEKSIISSQNAIDALPQSKHNEYRQRNIQTQKHSFKFEINNYYCNARIFGCTRWHLSVRKLHVSAIWQLSMPLFVFQKLHKKVLNDNWVCVVVLQFNNVWCLLLLLLPFR